MTASTTTPSNAPTESTMIKPAKMAHFVLRSPQPAQVVAWWQEVLGARIVHSNDILTFITYDDEHHRIAVVANPKLGDQGSKHAGLEHVAYTYASLEDLVLTYQRLRESGITPVWTINHGMTLSLYYADPDGNQCELQVDLITPAQADAFMKSPEFAENPLGITFDPEDMLADYLADRPIAAVGLYGPQ